MHTAIAERPEARTKFGHRWKPGQSGNPTGLVKPERAEEHVAQLARKHTVAAINCLVSVMGNDENPPRVRIIAAEAILDRGWGKAEQHIEINAQSEATLRLAGVDLRGFESALVSALSPVIEAQAGEGMALADEANIPSP